MALELTDRQKEILDSQNLVLNIILKIDGIDEIFCVNPVRQQWKVGEKGLFVGQDDLKIGGTIENPLSVAVIDPKKSSKSIQQQLNINKGGSGSTLSLKIAMQDIGGQVTEILSPGNRVGDILGRRAEVFLGINEGAHPEDSFIIFNGLIESSISDQGYVVLNVAHPSKLEDKEIFIPFQSTLSEGINSSTTTIKVEDDGILNHAYFNGGIILETFISIDDEVIRLGSANFNGAQDIYTGCTRGAFNTIPASHDVDADVKSWYRLKGDAITLALALLLSGPDNDEFYLVDEPATMIKKVGPVQEVFNAVFFQGKDVESDFGVSVGDIVTLSGAEKTENNFTNRVVRSVGQSEFGGYFTVDGDALLSEVSDNIIVNVKTPYNVLPDGCGLTPDMVDVRQFAYIKSLISSSISLNQPLIKDEINALDFISEKLFLPNGLFQIPRKGKVSINTTLPSLAGVEAATLDSSNLTTPESLSMGRSISRYFYNSIVFKYAYDEIEDKPRQSFVLTDNDSRRNISVGNKILVVEATGLPKSQDSKATAKRVATNLLNRYKKAAETTTVSVKFSTGFPIEVSDSVIYAPSDLNVADTRNGTRDFQPRLMQVINKSLTFDSKIKLTLLDTTFSTDARYGTIGPASYIISGDTESIRLKGIVRDSVVSERSKWERYIGEKIRVRSYDYSVQAVVEILGFDEADTRKMLISELPFTPQADYVADMPSYDETSDKEMALYKQLHAFLNKQDEVVSQVDSFTIEVSDITKFFEGSYIEIRSDDYSRVMENEVEAISGNNIVLASELSETFLTGDKIELIGFLDGGAPYRIP